jgi:hypothetical protein
MRVPIITSEMLRIDPVTYVVSTREPAVVPAAPAVSQPLGRALAAFAIAGLAARAVELLAARR